MESIQNKMKVEYSEAFKRQLKRLARKYRQIKKDIKPVIDALEAGDICGDQVTGVNYTLYKVRAVNSDSKRGKSGGYRVIYYLKTQTRCILVTLYSKAEQSDISANDLERILKDIESQPHKY
ncbi:MAG: mRNA-degrading endonuclease RelE of RelBE toxin-antitoxin system [Alteromonadaceae bacterium]|jgi:mRNA-degrading endonuclease RelE of RelBE toxin-antitoxin system